MVSIRFTRSLTQQTTTWSSTTSFDFFGDLYDTNIEEGTMFPSAATKHIGSFDVFARLSPQQKTAKLIETLTPWKEFIMLVDARMVDSPSTRRLSLTVHDIVPCRPIKEYHRQCSDDESPTKKLRHTRVISKLKCHRLGAGSSSVRASLSDLLRITVGE